MDASGFGDTTVAEGGLVAPMMPSYVDPWKGAYAKQIRKATEQYRRGLAVNTTMPLTWGTSNTTNPLVNWNYVPTATSATYFSANELNN